MESLDRHHGEKENGYCSLWRNRLDTISSEEEGIQVVERILSQEFLCRHDIDRLNKIHQTLGVLKGRVGKTSDPKAMTESQKKVHDLVIRKIERIRDIREDEQTITSENVITLYHIRDGISFIEFSSIGYIVPTFERRLEVVKPDDIAVDLPFCDTEEFFNKEVEVLLELPLVEVVLKRLGLSRREKHESSLTRISSHKNSMIDERDVTPSSLSQFREHDQEEHLDLITRGIQAQIRESIGLPPEKFLNSQESQIRALQEWLPKLKLLLESDPFATTIAEIKMKRKKFEQFKGLDEQILEEKRQLAINQQNYPDQYPYYLNELLDLRCLNLYRHLVKMRVLTTREDRDKAAQTLSFSEICNVVVEFSNTIIRKVRNALPKECKNVIFLLGESGAGKSTAFCFLRGDQMALKDFRYESKENQGNSLSACTFFPNVGFNEGFAIVDFPAFDAYGPIISLCMEQALKVLVKEYHPKIMGLIDIAIDGHLQASHNLAEKLKRISGSKDNCILGITKYLKNPHFNRFKALSKQKDEEEMQKAKKGYEEIERIILEATGFKSMFPFYDLEEPGRLKECLTLLAEAPAINIAGNTLLSLDLGDVKLLNVGGIEKILEEFKGGADADTKRAVESKLNSLRDYIQRTLGPQSTLDPEKTEQEWDKIMAEYASVKKEEKK